MSEDEKFLIWWTSQQDCEQIAGPEGPMDAEELELAKEVGAEADISGYLPLDSLPWPKYIREQFNDRWGRSGRGRLWISSELPQDIEVNESFFEEDRPLVKALAEECAGIVIKGQDGLALCSWPGFITDFSLQIWRPK